MTLHDLETGSKVKFDPCKRFVDHIFQEVVFSFQIPRINDKGGVRAFRYAPLHLTKKMCYGSHVVFKANPKLLSGKLSKSDSQLQYFKFYNISIILSKSGMVFFFFK